MVCSEISCNRQSIGLGQWTWRYQHCSVDPLDPKTPLSFVSSDKYAHAIDNYYGIYVHSVFKQVPPLSALPQISCFANPIVGCEPYLRTYMNPVPDLAPIPRHLALINM